MSDQINLLQNKRRGLLNRDAVLAIFQFLAKLFLVITVLASITVFILNNNSNLPLLQQQDKTVSTNLTNVQQKIIKFLLIRERIQDITPLLDTNTSLASILTQIDSVIPTSVNVTSFDFTKNMISMTLQSPSLNSLNTVLDFMIGKVNDKQLFKKVTVNGLETDTINNVYILTVSAIYYE